MGDESRGLDGPTVRKEKRRPENRALRARIDALQREHELRLAELRHRFANAFQLLSGLIGLRRKQTNSAEARAHLSWIQDLIVMLGLLQKQLATASDETAFGSFLAEQAYLWRPFCAEQGVEIAIEAEDLAIPARTAVPLALIVHELVTNCWQHAFRDGGDGCIRIELKQPDDGSGELIVADDGVGLPPEGRGRASLGLTLVERLTAQVGGTLSIESAAGTVVRVRFSLS